MRVGVIGHRELIGQGLTRFVHNVCYEVLASLDASGGVTSVISAVAEGADTTLCEAALELGLPLRVIAPFAGYELDFDGAEVRARYDRLIAAAQDETAVGFARRSPAAYRRAMQVVVFRSDVLIAAWDGREHGSDGGTWQALTLARSLNKPFIHIDVSERSTSFHRDTAAGYQGVPATPGGLGRLLESVT